MATKLISYKLNQLLILTILTLGFSTLAICEDGEGVWSIGIGGGFGNTIKSKETNYASYGKYYTYVNNEQYDGINYTHTLDTNFGYQFQADYLFYFDNDFIIGAGASYTNFKSTYTLSINYFYKNPTDGITYPSKGAPSKSFEAGDISGIDNRGFQLHLILGGRLSDEFDLLFRLQYQSFSLSKTESKDSTKTITNFKDGLAEKTNDYAIVFNIKLDNGDSVSIDYVLGASKKELNNCGGKDKFFCEGNTDSIMIKYNFVL
ncbi:MAG: hypothetical protein QM538_07205 [Methylacidiphilales bacterium]|nr:hypothetical protein [Candidatus Methylacidiphilales bacterium]